MIQVFWQAEYMVGRRRAHAMKVSESWVTAIFGLIA